MEKTCPRCGSEFECLHDVNILKCQCAGIQLSVSSRALIQEQYGNQCLCRKCLLAINE